ncbi:AEC family transporter [Thomasclavelia saccharogumia]|uniref:AEC family transporter n=1 Tax=Thomasclavelia saccharogumia TaxID=341225 RepID=UPI0004797067|nr:AEC family transporter [Thomasclavelia saccharogumia]
MVDFNNLIDLQIEIFFLMIVGYVLRKLNIISSANRKSLTDLVIYVILPANIIYSFMIKMDGEIIRSGLMVLIVSIVIQLVCSFLGKYFFVKALPSQQSVLQYGTICSNAGFMGSPLIQGLYGSNGLLFASIYLIPQRIVMWSGGVACFTSAKGKDVIKKVITHPCIIAVFIGLIIMISQVQLPNYLDITIKALSNCNMALSMIVIGGILAEISIKEVINKLTFYYSFIRLIFIPLLVLLGCVLVDIPPLVTAVSTVLAGMPAGTTTAILAEKYAGDAKLAVEIVFLSTALSLITIPLLCIIINLVV